MARMKSKYFNRAALKELRERDNITQQQLAEKIGVSCYNVICMWEIGARTPSLDLLVEMARFFDVELEFFILPVPEVV